MGKPKGFLEFEHQKAQTRAVAERLTDWQEQLARALQRWCELEELAE